MPALLTLVASRPQLLAAHAEAYAALVSSEVGRWSALWQRRVLLRTLAWCNVLVSIVLAGVALMLWSALPGLPARAAWGLVGVPLLPMHRTAGRLARAPAAGAAGARPRWAR